MKKQTRFIYYFISITKDAEKDQKFDKPARRQCLFYVLRFIVKCKQ